MSPKFKDLREQRGGLDPTAPLIGKVVRHIEHPWYGAVGRARLRHIPFKNATRKTFASWLGNRFPYPVVQKLMAHEIAGVTGRHYLHVTEEAMRDAVNSLPQLLELEASPPRLVNSSRRVVGIYGGVEPARHQRVSFPLLAAAPACRTREQAAKTKKTPNAL